MLGEEDAGYNHVGPGRVDEADRLIEAEIEPAFDPEVGEFGPQGRRAQDIQVIHTYTVRVRGPLGRNLGTSSQDLLSKKVRFGRTKTPVIGKGTVMEPRRVLVIEDDPAVRLALEVFLSAESAVSEVSTAADGDSGLSSARDFRPHVIVTDSTMPGTSGDKLGRSLRSTCPDATIISFSGLLNEASWADHRIQKGGPDTFDALAQAVTNAPTVRERVHQEAAALPHSMSERQSKIHDLRNGLTPLAGYASLLEAEADTMEAAQVREIAERMRSAIDRMIGMLNEL